MGFDIAVREEEVFLNEDRRWLGARMGTGYCRTVTLDPTLFEAAHVAEKNAIPSGTLLGQVTATKKYGPYDPAASDGSEVAAGHLFSTTAIDLENDYPVGVALFWCGIVKTDFLPAFTGTVKGEIDSDARDALTMIRYEDD